MRQYDCSTGSGPTIRTGIGAGSTAPMSTPGGANGDQTPCFRRSVFSILLEWRLASPTSICEDATSESAAPPARHIEDTDHPGRDRTTYRPLNRLRLSRPDQSQRWSWCARPSSRNPRTLLLGDSPSTSGCLLISLGRPSAQYGDARIRGPPASRAPSPRDMDIYARAGRIGMQRCREDSGPSFPEPRPEPMKA